MNHVHVGMVATFRATMESVGQPHPTFRCFYRVNTENLASDEEIFIFSLNGQFNDDTEKEYMLADFFYYNHENTKVRCKVFCPLLPNINNFARVGKNICLITMKN